MLALGAGTDFKIGGSVRIDVCRKEQFVGIVPDGHSVGKFHDGKPIVEDLERGFLSLALEHVANHEHRLTLSLRAEIAQGVLRGRWHKRSGRWNLFLPLASWAQDVSVTDGNLYHRKKNDVKVSI